MKTPYVSASRLLALYLILGLAWIFFSDHWLRMLVHDRQWLEWIQSVKGGVFVLLTGAVFFYLARKVSDEQRRLAQRDSLTGLYNRSSVREQIDSQISLAASAHYAVAVFCLNLDAFKHVNTTFGTAVGDEVLLALSHALRRHYGTHAVLGRIGADEFVISVVGRYEQSTLDDMATDLLQLPRDLKAADERMALTGTIGLAVYPQDGNSARELVAAGDTAVDQARTKGLGAYSRFNRAFSETVGERIQLLSDLKQAIEQNDMTVVYQAQFCAQASRCTGVEALLRWHHAERGWVPPVSFIPLAEQHGLIRSLSWYVLTQAVAELTQQDLLGKAITRVSINLSAHDFAAADHLERILNWLQGHPRVCQYLQFEITESAIMDNIDLALRAMNSLRELGVRFSIDDFGTGYSSLSILRTLPVTELKVDRTFIRDIPEDQDASLIARTVIMMAQSLHLTVVAEGVETEAQRSFLQVNHCDELQGFLLARPVPVRELAGALMRPLQDVRHSD